MFIISEIFPQHGGDLYVAEQMIQQSKLGGANAVKVQLYPGDMFPAQDGTPKDYLDLDFQGLKRLKEYADRISIDLFATPFTSERLGWCLDLGLKYLKIAARMHSEQPALVDEILGNGIPTFVSIPAAMAIENYKTENHATYLYCVSKYPTRLDELSFPDFGQSIFSGVSDHSIGISGALMASSRGASVLEKHFTLSHSFQVKTEQAHLGAMTMGELAMIKNISTDFEKIRSAID